MDEAIQWVKSVNRGASSTDAFPQNLQDLLAEFNAMSTSTQKLGDLRRSTDKVLAAARAKAEQWTHEAGSQAQSNPEQKRAALKAWLIGKEESCKSNIEKLEAQHAEIRDSFESKIQEAIWMAFREWTADVASAQTQPAFNDIEFMKELDAEFEALVLKESENGNTACDLQVNGLASATPAPKAAPTEAVVPKAAACAALEATPTEAAVLKVVAALAPTPEATPTEAVVPKAAACATPTLEATPTEAVVPKAAACATPTLEATPTEAVVPKAEALSAAPVIKRVFVPKGAGIPIVQKKVNIFDPKVCKNIGWSETAGENVTGDGSAVANTDTRSVEDRVAAISKEYQRKDTSDLDKESQPIGEIRTLNPATGKLETPEERDARLSHNAYMRFSRSFRGLGWMKDI